MIYHTSPHGTDNKWAELFRSLAAITPNNISSLIINSINQFYFFIFPAKQNPLRLFFSAVLSPSPRFLSFQHPSCRSLTSLRLQVTALKAITCGEKHLWTESYPVQLRQQFSSRFSSYLTAHFVDYNSYKASAETLKNVLLTDVKVAQNSLCTHNGLKKIYRKWTPNKSR